MARLERLALKKALYQTLIGDRKKMLKINVLAASTLITGTIIQYQKQHPEIRFQIVQNTDSGFKIKEEMMQTKVQSFLKHKDEGE